MLAGTKRSPHRLVLAAALIAAALIAASAGVAAEQANESPDNPSFATLTSQAPLPALLPAPFSGKTIPITIEARIEVPESAPADLTLTAFATDQHGRWHQSSQILSLEPGVHHAAWDLGPHANLQPIGHGLPWSASSRAEAVDAGLQLNTLDATWSDSVTIHWLPVNKPPATAKPAASSLVFLDPIQATGLTGQRWSVTFQPDYLPENPFDPELFSADLKIIHPDGTQTIHPAFYDEPQTLSDAGDHQRSLGTAPGLFRAQWRPLSAGNYRAQMIWKSSTHGGEIDLGKIIVSGEKWDEFVRIDSSDRRFFSLNGDFFWPIGININDIADKRGLQRTPQVRMTPERGTLSYDAYLQRCAAVGINSIEIWLASFNLGLEWIAAWPEFRGIGRYNMANAKRLDDILDRCHELGIRVNFVVHNHGFGSKNVDREWSDSPYNSANGGPFDSAKDLFTDPFAKKMFARHRRYLIGRWADHPALLGWKLWSEVNLTAIGNNQVSWHQQALAAWHLHDPYARIRTTHWAGDFRSPHRGVVSLEKLDYVCVNAYHKRDSLLSELIFNTTAHPTRGLNTFEKPILVTEYGGGSQGGNADKLQVDHLQGPFASVTAGLAGSAMSWWTEYIDQNDFWSPFIAVRRFLHNEDLRSRSTSRARSIRLRAEDAEAEGSALLATAWARPGRVLGYLIDRYWGRSGTLPASAHHTTVIIIAENAAAGELVLEWWNPDTGTAFSRQQWQHPGGELRLQPPTWQRHLAWKLWRIDTQQENNAANNQDN